MTSGIVLWCFLLMWSVCSSSASVFLQFYLLLTHIFNSRTFRETALCKGSYYCSSKLSCSGYFTFLVLFIPPYRKTAGEDPGLRVLVCDLNLKIGEKVRTLFFFSPFCCCCCCCCCCCFKDVLILFCTKHPWQLITRCQTESKNYGSTFQSGKVRK